MLDVGRLRVLREVAAHGSFSRAAEALDYSQSAVSQQVATLEREVGMRLLERSSRGVALTEPGALLVGHATAVLDQLARAQGELDALTGLQAGRLRLTTFATAGATIMPRAIQAFRARYPGIALSLDPAEPPQVRSMLRSGEADLCLTIDAADEPFDEAGEFDLVHLLDDPMFLLLAAEHPLAQRGGPVALAELAAERWIIGSGETCPDPRLHLRACHAAGFEPEISFHSDDYAAVQGFVAGGFGVALVPELALWAPRPDIAAREVAGSVPVRRILVATLAGTWASPARLAMIDVLREAASDLHARG